MSDIAKSKELLKRYSIARIPFISVNTIEPGRALDVLKEIADELQLPFYVHTLTKGVYDISTDKALSDDKSVYGAIDFMTKPENIIEAKGIKFRADLTAILDYYANLLLAIDFDSFSPLGGQRFYDRAQSIVQQQQSSGEIGWRTFEDNKNRAAVLNSYTESNTSGIRNLLYNYHRKGLDEMVTSPDKGRAVITESLEEMKKIGDNAPMSVALSIFRDAKLDELVNVYSKAPDTERTKAYDILQPLYPTEQQRLDKIKNPEQ